MRRILMATDFSGRSARALQRAALLCQETGAALTITHVVDDDQPQRLIDAETREARNLIEREVEGLRDLSCDARVDFGEPFLGILNASAEVAADLIVMGAHRRRLLRDVFVGTTLERVMRLAPTPVLMVNADGDGPYRRCVAAVDLSECSADALRAVEALSIVDRADVTILYVYDAIAKTLMVTASVPEEEIDRYVADENAIASKALFDFLAQIDLGDIRRVARVAEGSPSKTVARIAAEFGADLIVLGTHGRTGVGKQLLGSVAEQIVRESERDVLVVPPVGVRADTIGAAAAVPKG